MQSLAPDIVINGWKGKVFYNSHFPTARKDAEEYAHPYGKILSLPEIVDGIVQTPFLIRNMYTTNSEEAVLHSSGEKKYLYLFHGCGILTARRTAMAWKQGPLIEEHAVFLTEKENKNLFEGRIDDRTEVPVYSVREFWRSTAFPGRYAIALDAKTATSALSGRQRIDDFYDDPLFVSRIGSPKKATEFLDFLKRLQSVFPSQTYGNWHPYNAGDFQAPHVKSLYLGAGTNGVCSVFSGYGGFPAVKVQMIRRYEGM